MPKIVVATEGSFDLSHDAVLKYAARKGIALHVVGKFFVMTKYARVPQETWQDIMARKDAGGSLAEQQAWQHQYDSAAFEIHDIARDDSDLVAVVEQLGDDAEGQLSALAIVDVPDEVHWYIEECYGVEWVAENHRTWGRD